MCSLIGWYCSTYMVLVCSDWLILFWHTHPFLAHRWFRLVDPVWPTHAICCDWLIVNDFSPSVLWLVSSSWSCCHLQSFCVIIVQLGFSVCWNVVVVSVLCKMSNDITHKKDFCPLYYLFLFFMCLFIVVCSYFFGVDWFWPLFFFRWIRQICHSVTFNVMICSCMESFTVVIRCWTVWIWSSCHSEGTNSFEGWVCSLLSILDLFVWIIEKLWCDIAQPPLPPPCDQLFPVCGQ